MRIYCEYQTGGLPVSKRYFCMYSDVWLSFRYRMTGAYTCYMLYILVVL